MHVIVGLPLLGSSITLLQFLLPACVSATVHHMLFQKFFKYISDIDLHAIAASRENCFNNYQVLEN